jgi:divalent metal cation (Fe/Co/Zn/Cd) transporter
LECEGEQAQPRREVTAMLPELAAAAREAALRVEGIRSCSNVRLTEAEGQRLVTLDCGVDPGLCLSEAHALATEAEKSVRRVEGIASASVHTEPARS